MFNRNILYKTLGFIIFAFFEYTFSVSLFLLIVISFHHLLPFRLINLSFDSFFLLKFYSFLSRQLLLRLRHESFPDEKLFRRVFRELQHWQPSNIDCVVDDT